MKDVSERNNNAFIKKFEIRYTTETDSGGKA